MLNLTRKKLKITHFFTTLTIIVSLLLPTTVLAGSFWDQFKDPKDGALDTSQWLVDRSGFLPVPIFITEPAVGYGAGVAALFFHKSKEDKEEEKQGENGDKPLRLPPSISAIAGGYSENDSWFVGGGHFGSWRDDSIRYVGGLGGASLNLKFYGAGNLPILDQKPLKFNIDGLFLIQEMTFRIMKTNFFIGGRYTFLTTNNTFDLSGAIPGIPEVQLDSDDAGLSLIVNYDSRDNILSPNRGHFAQFTAGVHDENLGGDFDYNKITAQSLSWWGVHPDIVLGVRLDGQFNNGRTPFYALPFIQLRGIPALRYQGEDVFVTEVEPRWDFTSRWSLVGFIGAGWAADSVSDFSGSDTKVAGGLGFRYLIARRLGLRAGLDIARGPEDTAIYITVGSGLR
jgi:hypothetical protein